MSEVFAYKNPLENHIKWYVKWIEDVGQCLEAALSEIVEDRG